ncbi:MAG: gliding motility-associated C-terminal domain-containing protein [Saprospiraceae bacterium]
MVRLLILVVCFLWSKIIIGQINLVPNSSFEELIGCPEIKIGNFDYFTKNWLTLYKTPDIYNACASSSQNGVPINGVNCYQSPKSGLGYAGIATALVGGTGTTEIIQNNLIVPLNKGKTYFIRIFVSPKACERIGKEFWCKSDGIGIGFADTLFQSEELVFGEKIPPVVVGLQNAKGNILRDTANWIEICGKYIATGTEKYIVVGNFRTQDNTAIEDCYGGTSSYLYIDDVGVFEFDPLPDTILICEGESKKIGQSFLDARYEWNTGSKDSIIEVNTAGTYILTYSFGLCSIYDTVEVVVIDDAIDEFPQSISICEDESSTISFYLPGSYQWSDGEFGKTRNFVKSGNYLASVENVCGIFDFEVDVNVTSCNCPFYAPNIISPNGSPENRIWTLKTNCEYDFHILNFMIYDRWGNLVYQNNQTSQDIPSWDGTMFGNAFLENGVYIWKMEYEYTRNEKIVKTLISGNVLLVK